MEGVGGDSGLEEGFRRRGERGREGEVGESRDLGGDFKSGGMRVEKGRNFGRWGEEMGGEDGG